MISAVILTKNEQSAIERCLKSLQWCDEIILIDDHSTDETVKLATKLGAKIYSRELNGDFAGQHNFGLEKAKGDWVLFVDADEVVSQELARQIETNINKNADQTQGYYLRRLDFFWGKWLHFGETGNIKLLRLGRKGSRQWKRPVHEYWDIKGEKGVLSNPLLHYPHPTIHEFIESINHWTDLDAKTLPEEGKKFSYFRTIANPLGKFLQNYFFRLGILDGLPGLVAAFMMSLHSLIVRVKLYDLSQTS